MSDERLRELERRYKESGSEGDQVAWLVARLRAGDLPSERLQLLAALDHEPARTALGEAGEALPVAQGRWSKLREEVLGTRGNTGGLFDDADLEQIVGPAEIAQVGDWALRLEPWGGEALLRAACAAGRAALPVFEAEVPGDDRPRAALEAAEHYLGAPSRGAGALAVVACRGALAAARDLSLEDLMPGEQAPARDAACAVNQVAKLAQVLALEAADPAEGEEARMVGRIHAMVASRAVRYSAGAAGCEAVQQAVRGALADWVLG